MHEQDIIDVLRSARGEVDAPAHRTHLRRALLMQKRQFAPLSRFLTIISMNRYYVSIGSVAAVVAVAMLVAVSPFSSHVVSAQEQVQRAYARAVEISPAVRAELETKMKSDMLATLAEAKAAPDLKIMTKEEFEKDGQFKFTTGKGPVGGVVSSVAVRADGSGEPGQGMGVSGTITASQVNLDSASGEASGSVAGFAASAVSSSWSPVKYLSYTDPMGRKVVLGLDANDTPVFKMSTMSAEDAKKMGGLPFEEAKTIESVEVSR